MNERDVVDGHLVRDLDCSSNFAPYGVGAREIFAHARVEKDECCWICANDRPETPPLSLDEVEDDEAEEDDGQHSAQAIGAEPLRGRVARDPDWHVVTVEASAEVTVEARHWLAGGALDLVLYDADGRVRALGVDSPVGGSSLTEVVAAGSWFLAVTPRDEGDFNFYELHVTTRPALP